MVKVRSHLCFFLCSLAAAAPPVVNESARGIPVVESVDVVVVGGSVAGVSAAMAAASQGRSVLLVAPRPYLGEDLCDTMRLWLEEGEKPTGTLSEKIFAKGSPAAPVRVKKTIEEEILKAGARFLLASCATGVLVDGAGRPAGIVMANRAGRQAVLAKVIIDATADGAIAARAGARLRSWPGGALEMRRVVLGGKPANQGAVRREIPMGEGGHTYYEYTLRMEVGDDFASLARAEQQARDQTYRPGQIRASANLFFTPPNTMVGRREAGRWQGFEKLELGHFQPQGVDRVFVAGGRADIPRAAAEQLARPGTAENVGRAVGLAAARQAAQLPVPKGVRLRGTRGEAAAPGDVRENLAGLRPTDKGLKTVPAEAGSLPVLGSYDVLVVGGGTAGAPAAIAAARRGAKVLVAEYQEGLGGVGTLGLIGRPYHGSNTGFTREVPFPDKTFTQEDKMEWYRREIRKAGGEIWFGVLGAGAFVEGNRVRGAVVVTPRGRGVVLAKVVIDGTGNADLAVSAGAGYVFGDDPNDIAMQGAGIPVRPAGASVVNTDYLLVDENDMLDVWRALVGSRQVMEDSAFDAGPLIQTRERRRVVGDHVLRYVDWIAGRTYPDTISYSLSDFDTHSYPTQEIFYLLHHDETSRKAHHPAPGGGGFTPYRCLLPRGLEGILVIGLGVSADRDAIAMVRMQRDLTNQGYAAGVAAAMAARAGSGLREIDVKALQRHLVEIGSLTPDVLEHKDSFPLPDETVRDAVARLPLAADPQQSGKPLAVILSHRERALPLLRAAYAGAPEANKLAYARVLGFLGDRQVAPALAAALDQTTQWDAHIKQGTMAEYAHLPTPLDSLILALARTRDPVALAPILRKLETLGEGVAFSHFRSVALALETLADPRAAQPLARFLARPGMRGHVMHKLEPLHDKNLALRRRTGPLREITLARALYRCGDHQGLGRRILEEYRTDLRGLFARHAAAVLGAGK